MLCKLIALVIVALVAAFVMCVVFKGFCGGWKSEHYR